MNWDALDECLRELLVVSERRRAEGLVLTVADAEHLLEKEPRRDFDTLLRILARIAGRSPDLWGGDIPLGQLFVLFSVDPTAPHGANYHLST
jgi:hypothetical protein